MANGRLLVQIASYNTNLQGDSGLPQDLVDWLAPTLQASRARQSERRPLDIVAVGFQELVPLHLGLAGLSGPVVDSRDELILSQIEAHAPNKERYSLIAKVVNVGVALLVYGRDEGVARRVCDVQTQWTGCGPAYMGNKGAVGVRFRVAHQDSGVGEVYTFVCAHLTAHGHKLAQRVHDYHHIVGTLLFPPLPGTSSTKPTTIYSTSHLFFFGDLNFRLAIPPGHPASSLSRTEFARKLTSEAQRLALKEFDQLYQERDIKFNIFASLREADFWKFICSYKYKLGETVMFDFKRLPAWTDRIMYTSYADSPDTPRESTISNLLYTIIPSYTTSDHKPIVSLLQLPPSTFAPNATTPPVLHLPATYKPQPDRLAIPKRYIGRIIGRFIGYCWCLLVLVGAGSLGLGVANSIIGLGIWGWWKSRWFASGTPRRT
ncbi:uncharacterized protein FIBRA_06916 [Fibroporia radiculosa]|uniref:Inositol polyphosphate-related phosphatase domain-containing protein n=1 Tax=Fibroporia radiculosa TaxID=599839 RepID=J4GCV9_9APHY|nr:uncharacterized protein FIBRA_06916 [Fibroporia radiculosa]CCM04728.1 predicted protein [Fibroporia radiculosa]